ncbi:MAG: hypothetical protein KG003_07640 [Bacteroidetes bacterium]|nr:hypothetical protein [Bacteroidota bacterium]
MPTGQDIPTTQFMASAKVAVFNESISYLGYYQTYQLGVVIPQLTNIRGTFQFGVVIPQLNYNYVAYALGVYLGWFPYPDAPVDLIIDAIVTNNPLTTGEEVILTRGQDFPRGDGNR